MKTYKKSDKCCPLIGLFIKLFDECSKDKINNNQLFKEQALL